MMIKIEKRMMNKSNRSKTAFVVQTAFPIVEQIRPDAYALITDFASTETVDTILAVLRHHS